MIKSLYQRPSNEKVIEIEIGQQTKLQTLCVIYNNQGEVIYEMHGKQLRKMNDINAQIFKNIEQIQNLEWKGDLKDSIKQIGEWKAFWQNSPLYQRVMYNTNGRKEGLCHEVFSSFTKQNYLVESGIYKDGIRVGKWMTNKFLWIGQSYVGQQLLNKGIYNGKGQKIRRWIELHPEFSKNLLLIYKGRYFDDVKNGIWWTKFKYFSENSYSTIGGGTYVNGLKNGYWIDTCQYFNNLMQFLESGTYNQGVRTGIWTIKNNGKNLEKLHFPNMIYDENGQKQGIWMEISKYLIQSEKLVTFIVLQGCYVDGEKDEYWDILLFINNQIRQKGGGRYNQGKKVGKWKELELQNDQFWRIEQGEYKDGKKYGLWESFPLNYRRNWDTNTSSSINTELFPTRIIGTFNQNGKEEGCWMYLNETDQYNKFNCLNLQRVEFINGIKKINYQKTF
ncbi:unnamed protein product [Paramecium octaurelia]|uniref:Uncharacterized protein n=1 Tax=Paramecium octaurelia TaxID=43137 RepID=A0A8S1WZS2_PAROT|nr:unnamed protein product [Paramecium octaurelia]